MCGILFALGITHFSRYSISSATNCPGRQFACVNCAFSALSAWHTAQASDQCSAVRIAIYTGAQEFRNLTDFELALSIVAGTPVSRFITETVASINSSPTTRTYFIDCYILDAPIRFKTQETGLEVANFLINEVSCSVSTVLISLSIHAG